MKYVKDQGKRFQIIACFFILASLVSCSSAGSGPVATLSPNDYVLAALKVMPAGGGYDLSKRVDRSFASAFHSSKKRMPSRYEMVKPSYCSSATYFVFIQALLNAEKQGELHLSPSVWASLKAEEQKDGVGVWGRWNANGPGTAKLFHDLKLGVNFSSLTEAKPGDFLKIFWNDHVGKKERGHSVVFLGSFSRDGVPYIRFWSSNSPSGYGEKSVPLNRCKKMIFSRLKKLSQINRAADLPLIDPYLSTLLKEESSWEQAVRFCKIR